jgi:hypothetical protein
MFKIAHSKQILGGEGGKFQAGITLYTSIMAFQAYRATSPFSLYKLIT